MSRVQPVLRQCERSDPVRHTMSKPTKRTEQRPRRSPQPERPVAKPDSPDIMTSPAKQDEVPKLSLPAANVEKIISYQGFAERVKEDPVDAKDEHLYEVQESALGFVWLTPICFMAVPLALYVSSKEAVDAGLFDGPALLFDMFDNSLLSELARLSTQVDWNVLLAGFLAQLVDGSLGMGFGITSATVLTSWAGVSPLMASSAVHLAQLGTTAVSGVAHHRQGNTDAPTLRHITPAGVVGALIGSTLLSTLPTKPSKLLTASTLFAVGAYVLARFSRAAPTNSEKHAPPAHRAAFLWLLGALGGTVDAMGGGGWGPVATSGLLAEGKIAPSTVIGTVSLSEFFVTVAAVVGFLCTLGTSHAASAMRLDLASTLLAGGLLSAPIAPLLVSRLEPRRLGLLIGAFICFTNGKVLWAALAPRLA